MARGRCICPWDARQATGHHIVSETIPLHYPAAERLHRGLGPDPEHQPEHLQSGICKGVPGIGKPHRARQPLTPTGDSTMTATPTVNIISVSPPGNGATSHLALRDAPPFPNEVQLIIRDDVDTIAIEEDGPYKRKKKRCDEMHVSMIIAAKEPHATTLKIQGIGRYNSQKDRYGRERDCKLMDLSEMRAFFGLLYMAGFLRNSKLNTSDLWSTDGTGVEFFRLGSKFGMRRAITTIAWIIALPSSSACNYYMRA
ncbi:hypothetical protein J437_LFUL012494 [Ladona fulva]|uniref:PiggyBac transposable element-derived protein domain-containing protein n=1 Tax=Ladona fulva TaxID=123851 RepID=A0A8K0KF45_LADFU|nr:hypothetical protein J437_LFUL012494 [Ladona fulva]